MSLFHEQENRRGFIDQTKENSGRHAVSYGSFDTTGSGEITQQDPLVFGVPYIDMPVAAYSYYIEEENLIDTRWPRCWGGVYGWEKNEHGMFIGANVFVIVETTTFEQVTTITDTMDYTITHFFTFNGMALKFVPDDFASMQRG